jgi:hypothetical protein
MFTLYTPESLCGDTPVGNDVMYHTVSVLAFPLRTHTLNRDYEIVCNL